MADTFTKQSISAAVAQKMVAAAVAKAEELGIGQVVAVLDESGLLKAFCRMEGTPLVSIEASQNKAYTALLGMPSQEFFNSIKDDPALVAGVPHLPRIVTFGGGLPIRSGDAVVGAIGVSGGTVEQDIACAQAGLDAAG
ncbi:MAG: heme-binding protein [Desulfurellaceae bacterium]|nr:heme-binding protein [Desulfurellaceae bacterium]